MAEWPDSTGAAGSCLWSGRHDACQSGRV